MARVVVFTGSRDLHGGHRAEIERILDDCMLDRAWCLVGCCPSGLDAMVRQYLRGERHTPRVPVYPRLKVFVADWKKHGRKAGPLRNEDMVNAAVELAITNDVRIECFAWPRRGRGTKDCMKRAREAGATITEL